MAETENQAFITGADLTPFCPTVPQATLDKVAENVNNLFSDLLPLRKEERKLWFMMHEITLEALWLFVYTSLLNIQSAKYGESSLEIIPDGRLKNWMYFKSRSEMEFYPQLYISILSGYDPEELPWRIKKAMIDYAVEEALTMGQGFSQNITSYKMWDREIRFSWDSKVFDKAMSVVRSFQPRF